MRKKKNQKEKEVYRCTDKASALYGGDGKAHGKMPGRKETGRSAVDTDRKNGKNGPQDQSIRSRVGGTKLSCRVSGKCGGCAYLHKSYEQQLDVKRAWLKEQLKPFGKPEEFIGMENPYHYRNKVHAAFGMDRRHQVISGIYEEESHRIVPVDSCLIEDEKADKIILTIRKLLPSFKIRPYNEDTGYGLLRHVLVRCGHSTGQIMVVLVLGSPILPSKNNFVKALLKEHPEITTVVINVNGKDTSMVLGEKEQVIYGKGYIEDVLCGKTFRISPKSFYQVNPVQTERLYSEAMKYAALSGKEIVVDAYCGTGTIGMIAADHAKEVIGVELNGEAVKDAVSNAKRNGIKNISFYKNDAGKFLVEMAEQKAGVDVLFMDPPRSGSSEEFLGAVHVIKPSRIVYISCNPETLARDLAILKGYGYSMKRAAGVDMFPWTRAVECVTLLEHKGNEKGRMAAVTKGETTGEI